MTHEQFIAWLADVEARYPVTTWRVAGIPVWPMMRVSLYARTFGVGVAAHSASGRAHRYASVLGGLVAWFRAALRDAPRNTDVRQRGDVVFLAYSLGTQSRVAGRRCNQLLAPYVELVQRSGRTVTVWEMSPFGEYNLPRYTPSAFIQPTLLRLRAQSLLVHPRGVERTLPEHDAFVRDTRRAGLEYVYASALRLDRDVWFVRRLADTFKRWLRRVRPTHGFVADASLREQAFCLACREIGVTSVEIQHGLQGDLHPIYGSWTSVPEDGWWTQPRLYWSWDEASAAAIERWARRAPGAHGAVVGGDPWMSAWFHDGSSIGSQLWKELGAHVTPGDGRHHILVTLSYLGDVLPAPVREALTRAPKHWRFWMRLHPVNQHVRRRALVPTLPALGLSPADVDRATAWPLPALLRVVDANLSVGSSTVVQQAARQGVRSVACDPEAATFFANEVTRDMARVARTGSEVLAGLQWALDRGREPPAPEHDPVRAMAAVLEIHA